MLIKIHRATRYVVAICDTELYGQKFEDPDGIRQIDLNTQFFKGEEQNEEQMLEVIKDYKREDASFNIVGEKACTIALKSKLISKKGIISIAGIPIALVLL